MWAFLLLLVFAAPAVAQVQLPDLNNTEPIQISAQAGNRWQDGSFEIWVLRGVDVAARYGGDEFVALLPETDPSGAYVVAEKILQGVSELMVEGDGQRIMASLSIGVVSYPDYGQTADELMIAADEAMYLSKGLGGNRVVGYADPGNMPAPALSQAP